MYKDRPVDDYENLIAKIQRRTEPGERIFVGNARHDQIFINDAMLYFLSDRLPATRIHELHHGLATTTTTVQRQIIEQLEDNKVRLVVLRDEGELDPRCLPLPPDATVLDDYLREHFAPVAQYGRYELRQAKP